MQIDSSPRTQVECQNDKVSIKPAVMPDFPTIYNCKEVPEAFKLQNNTQEALWSLRTYAEAKVEVLAE